MYLSSDLHIYIFLLLQAVPCIVVVTANSFIIVDPKSYKSKLAISLADIVTMFFSPFSDGTVVVRSKPTHVSSPMYKACVVLQGAFLLWLRKPFAFIIWK